MNKISESKRIEQNKKRAEYRRRVMNVTKGRIAGNLSREIGEEIKQFIKDNNLTPSKLITRATDIMYEESKRK